MPDYRKQLKELLEITIQEQASDLHVTVGHPPVLRIAGRLVPLKGKSLAPADTEGFAMALMTENQQQIFLKNKEMDFSYALGERARFRVNIFYQRGY